MNLKDFFADKLQEFDDRHSIDFGEAEVTIEMLSARLKQTYKEDREWLIKSFNIYNEP